MVSWLIIIGTILILLFCFVIFFGAPYLPTLSAQRLAALQMLELKQGQTLIELGCGDGSMLKECARRGIKAVGYELNPCLVVVAKARNFRHRKLVSVKWANLWNADISQADGIFVFLLPKFMGRLDKKIVAEAAKGTKLASYAFKVPNKKIAKQSDAVFLYRY
jgi:hypothetical protein